MISFIFLIGKTGIISLKISLVLMCILGFMGARTKPLKVLEPVAADTLTSIDSFDLPPAKAGVKLVPADQPEELVRLLHEEAKVF